jgi:glycosyltransferase involved in cell wall biosynthesis
MVSSVKLADLWQKMGYRVVVVCMGPSTPLRMTKEEVSNTLTIYRVRDWFLPDPLNYGIAPTFLFHVFRILKEEKPAIVIVNKVLFWSSLVVPFLRVMGHRPIVTTDTLVGMTWWPRGFFPKIIMGIGAWTVGWILLLFASKIVFFHPQSQKLLRFLGITKKSRVIPTGVDTKRYGLRHAERRPATYFDKLSMTSRGEVEARRESITVTYIGRLESVKGVDDFLAAASPLKEKYPSLLVQVVGWFKKDHPLVRAYAKDVLFTGLRDDIPDILAATDVFVLPSYSEGLSNALMEAMASGCACVATRTGGNVHLIEEGKSGLLFAPGDRKTLQEHLERLLQSSDLRHTLGSAAQKRIGERCSATAVMKEYATLFADVETS